MDDTRLPPSDTEHSSTTGRKSGRKQRIEIITRGEGRRVWEFEQKRAIVMASLEPGVRPSDVARLHGITSGQLYTWRREVLEGQRDGAPRSAPTFARVEIAVAPVIKDDTDLIGAAPTGPDKEKTREVAKGVRPPALEKPVRSVGLIEIVLPGGVSVRVDAQVDGQALRHVLAALEGR